MSRRDQAALDGAAVGDDEDSDLKYTLDSIIRAFPIKYANSRRHESEESIQAAAQVADKGLDAGLQGVLGSLAKLPWSSSSLIKGGIHHVAKKFSDHELTMVKQSLAKFTRIVVSDIVLNSRMDSYPNAAVCSDRVMEVLDSAREYNLPAMLLKKVDKSKPHKPEEVYREEGSKVYIKCLTGMDDATIRKAEEMQKKIDARKEELVSGNDSISKTFNKHVEQVKRVMGVVFDRSMEFHRSKCDQKEVFMSTVKGIGDAYREHKGSGKRLHYELANSAIGKHSEGHDLADEVRKAILDAEEPTQAQKAGRAIAAAATGTKRAAQGAASFIKASLWGNKKSREEKSDPPSQSPGLG